MSDNNGAWRIVHVYNEEDGKLQINALSKLCDDDYKKLKDAKLAITKFFASQNVTKSLIANRNDLLTSLIDMAKFYLDRVASHEEIIERGLFDMSRQFANMCSMFRSFLDHNDRYFIRNYGINSPEHTLFKENLSKEYDNFRGYRIVYNIRNYIQHYDMPPLALSVKEKTGEDGISIRIDLQFGEIMMDDSLKRKFSGKFAVTEHSIPLLEILEEWHASVSRIIEMVNEFKLRDVDGHTDSILGLRSKYNIDQRGSLALSFFEYMNKRPKKLNVRLDWLPETKAAQIASKDF